MIELAVRKHELTVVVLKGDQLDSFKSALESELRKLSLILKEFDYRRNQAFFTISGTMDSILIFLGDFCERWNVREMGVSKFARIMEISPEEAEEWYTEINQYKNMIMSKSSFESKVLAKIMICTDIKKLEFLKRHFMDQLDELIQTRIDTLLGNEGEYEAFLKRQTEKQEILNSLKANGNAPNSVMMKRIISFIENS